MINSEQIRTEEIDGFPNKKNINISLIGYYDSGYYYFAPQIAYHQA